MPSPVTSQLPIPKSWDEFEDICLDLLKEVWKDPHATRNGRKGQKQDGVDIFGKPYYLNEKISGAQCKNTTGLSFDEVTAEINKAKEFEPALSEYLVMTTASRDAKLQAEIRKGDWPFRVEVRFWEDISLDLSGHQDLLKKHYPNFFQKRTSCDDVKIMILNADPSDFKYNDHVGEYIYNKDIKLRFIIERRDEVRDEREISFNEPWANSFPDPNASKQKVFIRYGETDIEQLNYVHVDGLRYLMAIPRSSKELVISNWHHQIMKILNPPHRGSSVDDLLRRTGIVVDDEWYYRPFGPG